MKSIKVFQKTIIKRKKLVAKNLVVVWINASPWDGVPIL